MSGHRTGRPEDDPTFGRAFGQLRGPLHWPSLTSGETAESLATLTDWVRQLVERFGIDHRAIPPCWACHPGLVEVLSALRDHERGSYADTASPTAGIDFVRALHDARQILTDLVARTGCTVHEHRDPPPGWPAVQHDFRADDGASPGGAPPVT